MNRRLTGVAGVALLIAAIWLGLWLRQPVWTPPVLPETPYDVVVEFPDGPVSTDRKLLSPWGETTVVAPGAKLKIHGHVLDVRDDAPLLLIEITDMPWSPEAVIRQSGGCVLDAGPRQEYGIVMNVPREEGDYLVTVICREITSFAGVRKLSVRRSAVTEHSPPTP